MSKKKSKKKKSKNLKKSLWDVFGEAHNYDLAGVYKEPFLGYYGYREEMEQ